MKSLNIIFMGTPDFAVPTLKALYESKHKVIGVITSVDKYGGRGGKKLLQSPVKKFAEDHGIKVLQPKNLKSVKFNQELQELKADIQVVVAFRMLPEIVWNAPPLGTINLHASLLPKYRGAAPINWAVINGEKETGLTTFKLKHEIDTGDLIMQKKVLIELEDTAGDVHDKLMNAGSGLMVQTIDTIAEGNVNYQRQDNTQVSKAPKIFRETCKIDFNKEVNQVYNFIRGLSPYPGSWCTLDEKSELKILKCGFLESKETFASGTLKTDNKSYLHIHCLGGYIDVKELQVSGKKRMNTKDLLNGYTFNDNHILT